MSDTARYVNGFHHIAMRTPNFDAAVTFYKAALGCEEVLAWGEGDQRAIMLDTGRGNCLELFAGGAAEAPPEGALLHFALTTDNCEAALNQAVAAGAEVTVPLQEVDIPSSPTATRVRIAFVRGPAGETIEFFQKLT
jgi:glyoxylase I family protein